MLSRRRFLGAAAASGIALTLRSTRVAGAMRPSRRVTRQGSALLDLGGDCALRESLAGWATTGASIVGTDATELARRALIVVPGAMLIPPSLGRRLLDGARDGATVVVESGALFSDAATVAAHVDSLRVGLGVDAAPPISLWPRAHGGLPYVAYDWPIVARVRDFSVAVPLIPRAGDAIIGRVDRVCVALRRRIGDGQLLVLGSPIGAALYAGDSEASTWIDGLAGRATHADRRRLGL